MLSVSCLSTFKRSSFSFYFLEQGIEEYPRMGWGCPFAVHGPERLIPIDQFLPFEEKMIVIPICGGMFLLFCKMEVGNHSE